MSAPAAAGHLAHHVMHFVRLLRAAGLPLGSERTQLVLQALELTGLQPREDFRAVLRSCLLSRAEQRELFDQAFDLFWHNAQAPDEQPAAKSAAPVGGPTQAPSRLGAVPAADAAQSMTTPGVPDAIDDGTTLSWSQRERLRKIDFDRMTADEWHQAQRLLARMRVALPQMRTRRRRAAHRAGQPDWRATMQRMARHGGELWEMRWREPRLRPAPLVLLADISGSMSRYSRMLMHFAHLLARASGTTQSFVFGTWLTHTTRLLKDRDPDLAVARLVREVQDWSGGTRITSCLHEFNQRWARRVLHARATVLLITDGLEAGDSAALALEMQRLHRSCARLVWLNPLLRYAAFEPRAGGIRAMMPHVDHFVPTHDLHSLEQLLPLLAIGDTATPRRPTTAR